MFLAAFCPKGRQKPPRDEAGFAASSRVYGPFGPVSSLLPCGLWQNVTVKILVRALVVGCLFGIFALHARAGFTSIYAFGDGVSCSASNTLGGSLYYPYTYSNGKIWVQVLAERQGMTYDANKNPSDMWHDSTYLLGQISRFSVSASEASTSLIIVWVCDADFVDCLQYGPYPSLDNASWNTAINGFLANHSQAITNLYAKGARTLLMPNAVDITKIPQYSGLTSTEKSFIVGKISSFNSSLATIVSQAKASMPGLRIIVPDFFSLLNNMVAHPSSYGFSNTTSDALDDGYTALSGPGANYLFWDVWDPTAKAHSAMVDIVQPMLPLPITPIMVAGPVKLTNGHFQFTFTNQPSALFTPLTATNLGAPLPNWTQLGGMTEVSPGHFQFIDAQPATNSLRFYRVRSP
jgi:hypothetical protein